MTETPEYIQKRNELREKYIIRKEKTKSAIEIKEIKKHLISIVQKEFQKYQQDKNIDQINFITVQKEVYRPLICNLTQGVGNKKKYEGQRYWSKEAIEIAITHPNLKDTKGKYLVQHEHVNPVVWISNQLIDNNDCEEILDKISSCVVSKQENLEIEKKARDYKKKENCELIGWERYAEVKTIEIFDFEENKYKTLRKYEKKI